MLQQFQSKLLLFYGGTLLLVLALFQFITTYGERNLQAPPNLNGRYLSSQPLPDCAGSPHLTLTILQSGIFLNGFLTLDSQDDSQDSPSAAAAADQQPTLTGRWHQNQVTLAGTTSALSTCQPGTHSTTQVTLNGQLDAVPAHTLTGQITFNGRSQPFTAQYQPAQLQPTGH